MIQTRISTPIMQLAVGYLAIAVHPSVPAKSLDELVKYAKGNPGKFPTDTSA